MTCHLLAVGRLRGDDCQRVVRYRRAWMDVAPFAYICWRYGTGAWRGDSYESYLCSGEIALVGSIAITVGCFGTLKDYVSYKEIRTRDLSDKAMGGIYWIFAFPSVGKTHLASLRPDIYADVDSGVIRERVFTTYIENNVLRVRPKIVEQRVLEITKREVERAISCGKIALCNQPDLFRYAITTYPGRVIVALPSYDCSVAVRRIRKRSPDHSQFSDRVEKEFDNWTSFWQASAVALDVPVVRVNYLSELQSLDTPSRRW